MENEMPVVDVQVVEENQKETNTAQKVNFQKQLEVVRKNLSSYQQAFEVEKSKGMKLEGAIESLDLLLKSLQK